MSWLVREADWDEDRTALCGIRRAVFIVEQAVPESLEWDDEDSVAVHFLALDGDEAVGVARLLSSGQIGRLAVAKSHRRQGIGSALLDAAIAKAGAIDLAEVYLHAQLSALPLYQSFGFEPEGDVFDEAGISHQFMRKTVA